MLSGQFKFIEFNFHKKTILTVTLICKIVFVSNNLNLNSVGLLPDWFVKNILKNVQQLLVNNQHYQVQKLYYPSLDFNAIQLFSTVQGQDMALYWKTFNLPRHTMQEMVSRIMGSMHGA